MKDLFITDSFRVLKTIYEHETEISGEKYARLSQQEIADILGFSKVKANAIINELEERAYVENKVRGKYSVTEAGEEIIKKIKL